MTSQPLRYPFENPPAAGDTQEIHKGLVWVRQSLPMALDHINVWLISNDSECVVVDTGMNMKSSQDVWTRELPAETDAKTVSKVVATHLHPDHCGLAGWLTRRYGCPLYMTRTEYLLCRTLCFDSSIDVPSEALDFYHAAGMTSAQLDDYKLKFGGFGRAVSPLPPSYHRIQDGDTLDLAGQDWNVITGSGHSPEHACLYHENSNTLISGDQILPRISSIVAVWPTEPESNPLEDWLHSCRELRKRLPEDVLVLPSHGLPFYGVSARLNQLIDHHESLLEQLVERCRRPQRVIDVFDVLFNSPISDSNLVMAIGETVAHFNYLRAQNLLTRTTDSDSVDWYST